MEEGFFHYINECYSDKYEKCMILFSLKGVYQKIRNYLCAIKRRFFVRFKASNKQSTLYI